MAVGGHTVLALAYAAAGIIASPVVNGDTTASDTSIGPAAATVSTNSPAGVQLFECEAIQLTEEVLRTIEAPTNATGVLALIGFDNSTDTNAKTLSHRSGSCKAFPGDSNYPKSESWSSPHLVTRALESTMKPSVQHMAPGNPMNVDNAVNEAWRNTQSFLITANGVPENATAAQLKYASDHLTFSIMTPWREVAPYSAGGGVYLNEADIQEPDWQVDFYGAKNYPRLLKIKQKWDPRGLFYATTAVGSEAWEIRDGEQGIQTQNGRLCRV